MENINASHYIFFSYGLNIKKPWYTESIKINKEKNGAIDVNISVDENFKFKCKMCDSICEISEFVNKTWRHVDFFDKKCYLSIKIPKLKCEKHGVFTLDTQFGKNNSNFSKLLEENILINSQFMPIKTMSLNYDIPEQTLWSIVLKNVNSEYPIDQIYDVNNLLADGTVSVHS